MQQTVSTNIAALILRVTSGSAFIAHGLLKLLVFTPAGTAGFFESLGLPGFLAYLTIFAELVGGAALILGVATRVVALTLLPVLLGAAWVHSGNGWLFSAEGGGWEFPVFWAMIQVVILALGSGAYALRLPVVDRVLGQAT
ncbi:Putative oxidoreductase CatD [Pelagimonas phthalicica]|uniref:Putative oxidoreductase CatD n=1 Tax=Pelagimonas phthalicica TaxID=1037362 RepID=A0A238JGL8_9RHOB|nr:DoxX family protein [Pelagimonas phthalicica]TDS92226.1 putative oxidoreductase [Pelagimonas phthalicica]SMX29287.1 Putative oxidoreductase CatD [Pelagimonas phthalicica]